MDKSTKDSQSAPRTMDQMSTEIGLHSMSSSGQNNENKQNVAILNAIFYVMDSSSESEDEETTALLTMLRNNEEVYPDVTLFKSERIPRNSIKNYFHELVPAYTDLEFRMHFRINRSLYETLSKRFLESEIYKSLRPDKSLSANLHLLVFLWFAGHEACSFSDLSDRFDLSRSTICVIINRVTYFISGLSKETIKWPNAMEKNESSQFFRNKCLFPKVIGCIDGTHIVIDPPTKSKDEYIDRKGNITVCMQGICNEHNKFLNIFVGYPGSCHDSWVLKNSPIYEKLPLYCGEFYLLGDSAYPCNKYLITPYKDNGHLTSAQKLFNIKLSSGRVAIEHSFGILKQRFRQLYYCKLRGMKKICHFIRACCVLHNIANDDDIDFKMEIEAEENEEFPGHGEVARGNSVRDPICDLIQRAYSEKN